MYGIIGIEWIVRIRSIEMDAREERGLVIANTSKIERNKLGWQVPSQ
jgi:hypothetical protein